MAGALLSMGDAHTAQGNSELDGTGIETSINGDFRVTLHKAGSLPPALQQLTFPLLENSNEWVVHGFTYAVGEGAKARLCPDAIVLNTRKTGLYLYW